MAGHLGREHETLVWNRSPERSTPEGCHRVPSLAELGSRCSVIFLCVNRTEDVQECLADLTSKATKGALFVDHSTIAPAGAIEIHEDLASNGYRFVDAPITGGSIGAQKGQLTIFCGGDEADIAEAGLYMKSYAKRFERVGGPGAGQMMKMANQIAVGGALLALCESLAFAEQAGLDLAQTRELLMGGAAGSWAFENYGPKILAKDWSPGFSVKNQRKDFAYCLDAAEALGMEIPGTELVDRLLAELQDAGRGEETTAALFEVLSRKNQT
jgi:3-hydroxyisobutyrate dehydrogenase